MDCVNSDGLNADALAVKHGHTQIVEMLREAREQKVVAAIPDAPRA